MKQQRITEQQQQIMPLLSSLLYRKRSNDTRLNSQVSSRRKSRKWCAFYMNGLLADFCALDAIPSLWVFTVFPQEMDRKVWHQ